MISVVIIARPNEEIKTIGTFKGYDELIIVRKKAHPSICRNFGGSKTKGDVILFLDSDMDLLGVNVKELEREFKENKYDLATAWYDTVVPRDRFIVNLRNTVLSIYPVPLGFWGGFMMVRKEVWEGVKFKEVFWEDVNFAVRVWLRGYRLGVLNTRVVHLRKFKDWVSPYFTQVFINMIKEFTQNGVEGLVSYTLKVLDNFSP